MTVLLVIVLALLVLVAVLLVNAARLKPTPAARPLSAESVEGDEAAVKRFQELLRMPTIWAAEDPDADHTSFDEFVPKLKELYPTVFEALELTMTNTYGVLLKWKGANSDLDPVVLMAHHDVVEATPKGWTQAPFGADIVDGKIYARGVLDTKCVWAALMEATKTLLAEGYVPPRDIYLFSSNCEEDNGPTAPKTVEYLKEQGITPYMVLDEGGAIIDNPPLGVEGNFALIGVAEKGFFNAHLATSAPGGHSSTPSPRDAPVQLVEGLYNLQKNPAPAQLNAPTAAMLKEVAAHASFGLRIVFGNLWLFKPLVLKILKGDSETAAMVRTTYAFTELEGSRAANVIPRHAKAAVNVRVFPGETIETASVRLKSHFPEGTEFEIEREIDPSPVAPFENDEAFDYLRTMIESLYPGTGVAPYVQTGRSDSAYFHRICPRTYRFAGFVFKGDQRSTIHGQDECMDVESYTKGIKFYTEFIRHIDVLGK